MVVGGAVEGVVGGTVVGGAVAGVVVGATVVRTVGAVVPGAAAGSCGPVGGTDDAAGCVIAEFERRGAVPVAIVRGFGRTVVAVLRRSAAVAEVGAARGPLIATGDVGTTAVATACTPDRCIAIIPASASVAENATPPTNTRAPEAAWPRVGRGGMAVGISRRSRPGHGSRRRGAGAWSMS